jgi:hypothetical protein
MAYAFNNANSRYLSALPSGLSGTPMTLACWVYPTAAQNDRAALAVGDGVTHRNTIQHNTVTLTGVPQMGAVSVGASGLVSTSSSTSYGGETPVDQWTHCAGVFSSVTSRTIYVGGILRATNATNCGSQNTFNEILIGARRNTSVGLQYTGNIADAAVWTVALTADEIASLAKGMTCDKVRPQSLVFYSPLTRDLIDAKGGLTITNNNTATVANHPRVYA